MFVVYFSMLPIRGSGSGLGSTNGTGSEIRGIIVSEVAVEIRKVISELFRSVKTALIEEFDRRNVIVMQALLPQPSPL